MNERTLRNNDKILKKINELNFLITVDVFVIMDFFVILLDPEDSALPD